MNNELPDDLHPLHELHPEIHLFNGSIMGLRDSGRECLQSLDASNRYTAGYLDNMELAIVLLVDYAEANQWPEVGRITTAHIEEYLTYLKHRPRWFNNRQNFGKPVSQSYLETNYRRLYRFFNWLVERGRIGRNPLKLIPHPHIDEKVIPVVSLDEVLAVATLLGPRRRHRSGREVPGP